MVDDQKSKTTAQSYVALIRRFLNQVDRPVTVCSLRAFLKRMRETYSRDHYALLLSALKAYFGRYRQMSRLVSTFKFPPKLVKPKVIPSQKDLIKFYYALPSLRMRAYFLLAASSGLRKGEVLGLDVASVKFRSRMLIPANHRGSTKHCWVSFYNEEAENVLMAFRSNLSKRQSKSSKLIPISNRDFKCEWRRAKEKAVLNITSKMLRDWFAEKMGNSGVADRYVDAFQGRTPKSVLARYYTDYSPEKLKRIYDRADLKVLA